MVLMNALAGCDIINFQLPPQLRQFNGEAASIGDTALLHRTIISHIKKLVDRGSTLNSMRILLNNTVVDQDVSHIYI